MNDRVKGLLILFLLFGILLTMCGINGLTNRTEKYSCPIYISKDFTLTCHDDYNLDGQFTNRTSQQVKIDSITFYLTGGTNLQKYYTYCTYNDIYIPANSIYDFHKNSLPYTKNLLNNAYISECIVNGEKCTLKYSSDGKIYEGDSNNSSRSKLMLIIGIILLMVSFIIIIFHFNSRKGKKI